MNDDFLIRGRERRVLRDALRATEDALFEIDGAFSREGREGVSPSRAGAASGERKVTPEALARGLRAILAGQIALMEAILGTSGAPGSTKGGEEGLGGANALQRLLDDARGVSGEAPGEARATGGSGAGAAPPKKEILSPRERAERAARFAARIGKGFKDDDADPAGDAPPRLRPLTLDDDEDDLSAVEAAQPLKRQSVESPRSAAGEPATPTPTPSPGAPSAPHDPSTAPAATAAPLAPLVYAGRRAAEPVALLALETFPLEEMNRWLSSGTVFQIRGAMAFLNMHSMGGTRIVEMSGNIRRMGFGDELGRLDAPGLSGSVLLFRRIEGA